jgi:hypothetical protein
MDQQLGLLIPGDLTPPLDGFPLGIEYLGCFLATCAPDGPPFLRWNNVLVMLLWHGLSLSQMIPDTKLG